MVTTIRTFRGYMVSTYDGCLENAKTMLKELIADEVEMKNRWVQWCDENDYLHTLTFSDGSLNLNVSKSVDFNIKLMW